MRAPSLLASSWLLLASSCYGAHVSDETTGAPVDGARSAGECRALADGPVVQSVFCTSSILAGFCGSEELLLDPLVDTFLPVSIVEDPNGFRVEVLTTFYSREFGELGFFAARLTYEVRFTRWGPYTVLLRAERADLETTIEAWREAAEARYAGGPLVCAATGEWAIWLGATMRAFAGDYTVPPGPGFRAAGLIVSARTGQMWALDFQQIPIDCQMPNVVLPCTRPLGWGGVWVMYGRPAGTETEQEDDPLFLYGFHDYCALPPVCEVHLGRGLPSCSSWIGTLRCDDLGWLDRACAARSVDDVPPPPGPPCYPADEYAARCFDGC